MFCDPRVVLVCAAAFLLSACSSVSPWFAASGPSSEIVLASAAASSPVPLVDVTERVARRQLSSSARASFAEAFPDASAITGFVVGPGDTLVVSIWEAPPAVLFGSSQMDTKQALATARETVLPEQMISEAGTISIPFVGPVVVAGQSPPQIASDIARHLNGKANQPQVIVRVSKNATANVTVVGEVVQSARLPLSARRERLLDAIAASGGVKEPVGKISIQVTRGQKSVVMPLDSVIQLPEQNIVLQPGDVVTALYQPWSFTALGATGKNDEIAFEAKGITLAQALGRINGLQDARSDVRGVFVFRFEAPDAFDGNPGAVPHTEAGLIPVIYRLDLRDPQSFLAAQSFPMRDRDVVYVANAPSAELQKFLNIITSTVYSISGIAAVRP